MESPILFLIVGVLLVLAIVLGIAVFLLYSQAKKVKLSTAKEIEEAISKAKQSVVLTEEQAIEKASQIARNKILEAEKKALQRRKRILLVHERKLKTKREF